MEQEAQRRGAAATASVDVGTLLDEELGEYVVLELQSNVEGGVAFEVARKY